MSPHPPAKTGKDPLRQLPQRVDRFCFGRRSYFTMLATSAAKSSAFFSMPSPVRKRI